MDFFDAFGASLFAYNSTCAGQCDTCGADECPSEMHRYLREISLLLPYAEDVDEAYVL